MEEQGAGAEEPDAGGGGDHCCSYPCLTSWHPQERATSVSILSFPCVFPFAIPLARITPWDRPERKVKGLLATCRHCADSGQETDCTYSRHDLIGRMRVMNKQKKNPPEPTARRNTVPKRVTIFSDAQAAIKRMASDEPGPGQQCALQERKHIAALRRAKQEIII